LRKNYKYRQSVFHELVMTEKNYIDSLELLVS